MQQVGGLLKIGETEVSILTKHGMQLIHLVNSNGDERSQSLLSMVCNDVQRVHEQQRERLNPY